jgi:hypothetical protein
MSYYEPDGDFEDYDEDQINAEMNFQNQMWDKLLEEPAPIQVMVDSMMEDCLIWLN